MSDETLVQLVARLRELEAKATTASTYSSQVASQGDFMDAIRNALPTLLAAAEAWAGVLADREAHLEVDFDAAHEHYEETVTHHDQFCICTDCIAEVAATHKAVDAACGKAWECSCASCGLIRGLLETDEKYVNPRDRTSVRSILDKFEKG